MFPYMLCLTGRWQSRIYAPPKIATTWPVWSFMSADAMPVAEWCDSAPSTTAHNFCNYGRAVVCVKSVAAEHILRRDGLQNRDRDLNRHHFHFLLSESTPKQQVRRAKRFSWVRLTSPDKISPSKNLTLHFPITIDFGEILLGELNRSPKMY